MNRTALSALAVAASIALPAPSGAAGNHFEDIKAYSTSASWAFFAEKNCTGISANKTKLLLLRTATRIRDDEEPMLEEDMRRLNGVFADAIVKAGRLKWCSDTWDLIGPGGKLMPGLLYRP